MTDSCSAFVAFEAKNRVLKGKREEEEKCEECFRDKERVVYSVSR